MWAPQLSRISPGFALAPEIGGARSRSAAHPLASMPKRPSELFRGPDPASAIFYLRPTRSGCAISAAVCLADHDLGVVAFNAPREQHIKGGRPAPTPANLRHANRRWPELARKNYSTLSGRGREAALSPLAPSRCQSPGPNGRSATAKRGRRVSRSFPRTALAPPSRRPWPAGGLPFMNSPCLPERGPQTSLSSPPRGQEQPGGKCAFPALSA